MEASPIRINEATAEALCQLEHIGPRRAERIIRYRDQVGPILTAGQLVDAADLTYQQAREMARAMDLSYRHAKSFTDVLLILIALTASGGYLAWGHSQQDFGFVTPFEITLNLSLLGVFTGCVIAIASTAAGNRALDMLATSFWIAGGTLILALAASISFTGRDDELARHIYSVWRLMVFTITVLTLQFLPAWLLAGVPGSVERFSQLFDRSQLLIATLLALFVYWFNSDRWIEEIFSAWAGLVFLQNGFELFRGASPFASALNDADRSRLQFLTEEGSGGGVAQQVTGRRLEGAALMLIASVFFWLAVRPVV